MYIPRPKVKAWRIPSNLTALSILFYSTLLICNHKSNGTVTEYDIQALRSFSTSPMPRQCRCSANSFEEHQSVVRPPSWSTRLRQLRTISLSQSQVHFTFFEQALRRPEVKLLRVSVRLSGGRNHNFQSEKHAEICWRTFSSDLTDRFF